MFSQTQCTFSVRTTLQILRILCQTRYSNLIRWKKREISLWSLFQLFSCCLWMPLKSWIYKRMCNYSLMVIKIIRTWSSNWDISAKGFSLFKFSPLSSVDSISISRATHIQHIGPWKEAIFLLKVQHWFVLNSGNAVILFHHKVPTNSDVGDFSLWYLWELDFYLKYVL